MKKQALLLLLTVATSVCAQVQNPRFGIRFVTRRALMVLPQIEANQFFAAGGVNVAGQPLAAQPGTQTLQTTPQLAELEAPPIPVPEAPRPVLVYRAPVKQKVTGGTSNSTNAVAAKPKYDPATSGASIRSHWAGGESVGATTPTVAAVEPK